MTPDLLHARTITRRHLFQTTGLGFGAMALNSLLAGETKKPMIPAKAKRVIYLHMAGSPSQLELFDYKPELNKFDGRDCPQSFLAGKQFAFIQGVPKMLGNQYPFAQHGQSGQWISDRLPHLSKVADELCIVKSMFRQQGHEPVSTLRSTR